MALSPQVLQAISRARGECRSIAQGEVRSILGIAIEVVGVRCALGELCTVHSKSGEFAAEVVGFRKDSAVLMPLADTHGIAPRDTVTTHGRPLRVPAGGEALLGRVVDALGRPLDGKPLPATGAEIEVTGEAPPALSRAPITQPVDTGIAAIDGFNTVGKGQRVGIFAGSGVGKSSLLGMIARGQAAEVNVIAMIGERGREVGEFLTDVLGPEGMAKSVVVVATSDAAPMLRYKGPFTAVAIAESFRAQGRDVLFMMDSVTRFAGAAREVGLAAGEPPTLRGYPPSLFAQLPRLVERLGNDDRGSITGLLTVLVDGDDFNEPVSDALRGYLDGHIVLDRGIAARGRFPAIDVLQSISRLMPNVSTDDHREVAAELRKSLALYEENRDLVQVGAYKRGSDPELDRAIELRSRLDELIHHGREPRPAAVTSAAMQHLLGRGQASGIAGLAGGVGNA